jgi:adenosine deaminase
VKRRALLIISAVLLGGAALALVIHEPPRPRPPGFDAPWDGLPRAVERDWGPDPQKRLVVQKLFSDATEELARCNLAFDPGPEGGVLVVDLLFEQTSRGMQLAFARAEEDASVDPRLAACITRELEEAGPVPTADVAPGTRWRLTTHIALQPASELPPPPWWHRFVPAGWRSGGTSSIHVGWVGLSLRPRS